MSRLSISDLLCVLQTSLPAVLSKMARLLRAAVARGDCWHHNSGRQPQGSFSQEKLQNSIHQQSSNKVHNKNLGNHHLELQEQMRKSKESEFRKQQLNTVEDIFNEL